MEIFFLLIFLLKFVANNIEFFALILAYLAYSKSIKDKYDSWKSLLQSFLDELNTMHNWIGGEYKVNDFDKDFYNPDKHVFRLTTVTSEEIVRKGVNELYSPNEEGNKYRDKLALFIERIEAFNSMTDHSSRISSDIRK